jgi:hypothetical protein
MKYLCLVYHDEEALESLSEHAQCLLEEKLRDFREDMSLRGHAVAAASLLPDDMATTLRIRDGTMAIVDGAPDQSKELLGEFYVIEARDLNDAIRVIARIPPVTLGCIEVRAIRDIDLQPGQRHPPSRSSMTETSPTMKGLP